MATQNLNDIVVKVHQLKQFCEQTKVKLSVGEENLVKLSKMIEYQAGASRTGQEAVQISNFAAKQLQDAVQSVRTLEREADAYIKHITS